MYTSIVIPYRYLPTKTAKYAYLGIARDLQWTRGVPFTLEKFALKQVLAQTWVFWP